jgi:hypothetical protein
MNFNLLLCCIFVCSWASVAEGGGGQQQIYQWFKTLGEKGFKTCDKKSKFEFKESNLLVTLL